MSKFKHYFHTTGLRGNKVRISFYNNSQNEKTGDMIQNMIISQDWIDNKINHKQTVISNGNIDDQETCLGCIHATNKDNTCYVRKGMGLNGLVAHTNAGNEGTAFDIDDLSRYENKAIRFGTYGDPVLVGEDITSAMANVARTWTGYTHQWRNTDYGWAKQFLMASVETEQQAAEAQAQGWRTFRVKGKDDRILPNEVVCPASKEAGKKVTCADCSLCQGTTSKAKNVVINKH